MSCCQASPQHKKNACFYCCIIFLLHSLHSIHTVTSQVALKSILRMTAKVFKYYFAETFVYVKEKLGKKANKEY